MEVSSEDSKLNFVNQENERTSRQGSARANQKEKEKFIKAD